MSIQKHFSAISRRFAIVSILLSVISVLLLTGVLYQTNAIRFGDESSVEEIYELAEENEALRGYLEDEKDFEAHFVSLSGLIRDEQQSALGQAMLVVALPILVIGALIGFIASRYLLRPVREAYDSQERFLQDAAHELRNPLAAMSVTIENAKQTRTKSADLLRSMERQTKRLIRMNEDLLYLERRKPGERISSIDISELTEDVLEDLQAAISMKELSMQAEITPDIQLKMDSKDYVKLLRNIVENAIKYSERGDSVSVRLLADKQHVTIEVIDTGIGMQPEDIERLGERFFRAKNVSRLPGSGLGIAIVQKVLNSYGGSMQVESKLHKGTTVILTLPR